MDWGLWLLIGAFTAISFAVSLLACRFVMGLNVVDAPDGDRKMQAQPVPRLGGLAILIGTLVGGSLSFVILVSAYGVDPVATVNSLISGLSASALGMGALSGLVITAFLIGLWDDIWTANTKLKLLILALACGTSAAFGLVPESLTSPWGAVSASVILIIGSALWLLVFINATNFMDGSNGLAIGCLAIMLAGLAFSAATSGTISFSLWWFPLFGAIAGFLMHNLRGRLYAGDAGALGLGALFAGLGLVSGLEVWTVATLALPFLIDVLLTLIWRAKHGRNWLDAHLDHAYQRLIDRGWTHLETAVLYWGLSATAAILAYIGAQAGGFAPFLIFWTLTLAGSLIWIRHRRAAHQLNLSD